MYTQQLIHLPLKSVDQLHQQIETSLNTKKYAFVIHDKDIDENGKLQAPHVHVMMSFENARSLQNVASLLNDQPQYIECWKGNSNNGYAYLVHATKDATSKYQYDPKTVVASFDYVSELQNIAKQVAQSSNQTRITVLLDALLQGNISKQELEDQLTGSQYAKYHKQIETIWSKRLCDLAIQWRFEMVEKQETIKVIWIYGSAGTGKTSFAKDYANKKQQDYYLAGSSKDLFQAYAGEHTLILDELRPGVIQYQDLLRIFDPFGITEKIHAPSRYFDKALACDLILVTSPFNPLEFYNQIFASSINRSYSDNSLQLIDGFDQLHRRIALAICMNEDNIMISRFDKDRRQYCPDFSSRQKNEFSEKNRIGIKPINDEELFKDMME